MFHFHNKRSTLVKKIKKSLNFIFLALSTLLSINCSDLIRYSVFLIFNFFFCPNKGGSVTFFNGISDKYEILKGLTFLLVCIFKIIFKLKKKNSK